MPTLTTLSDVLVRAQQLPLASPWNPRPLSRSDRLKTQDLLGSFWQKHIAPDMQSATQPGLVRSHTSEYFVPLELYRVAI